MNSNLPLPTSSEQTQLAPTPAREWVRWMIPLGVILTLVGYFGPWVDHKVAGLVIMGVDLGEYVKFLTSVRTGQVSLWREGFYLPLVSASLICSLSAFRAELHYAWYLRVTLIVLAVVSAFNLLPPAWTPQRMLTHEFRQQLIAIILCLGAVAFSPFLALLPRRMTAIVATVVGCLSAIVPGWQFLRVLPEISELYGHSLWPGWGLYTTIVGSICLAAAGIGLWSRK